jgi:hypothetical protein
LSEGRIRTAFFCKTVDSKGGRLVYLRQETRNV